MRNVQSREHILNYIQQIWVLYKGHSLVAKSLEVFFLSTFLYVFYTNIAYGPYIFLEYNLLWSSLLSLYYRGTTLFYNTVYFGYKDQLGTAKFGPYKRLVAINDVSGNNTIFSCQCQ